MNTIDRSHLRSLARTGARRGAPTDDHPSAPRLRPQLVADAVIAGYIHDISTRHHTGDSEDRSYELAIDREAA